MLDISPVYVTVDEVRECLEIPETWDWSKNDAEIEALIVKAQFIIDNEIGFCWTKEDSEQCFIFPTCEDWLPKNITLATIELIRTLCKESSEESSWTWTDCDNGCWSAIKSIKVWEVTTTFFEKWCEDSTSNDDFSYNWKSLISKYTATTIFTKRKLKLKCNPNPCCKCQHACQCQTDTK